MILLIYKPFLLMNQFNSLKERFAPHRLRLKINDYPERPEIYAERVAYELFDLLKENGKFYISDSQYYYFDNLTKTLHSISFKSSLENSFQVLLITHFNFTLTSKNGTDIYGCLSGMIRSEALSAQIYLFSHYSKNKNTLYVRATEQGMYRIQADKIELVDNGTDGIIFKPNSWFEDITVNPEKTELDRGYLNDKFFNKIWFVPGANEKYDRDHQAIMFKKWFQSIFFDELVTKRPLMVLQGATGTGKTSTLRNLGVILFGSRFSEYLLPKDERDFAATALTEQYLIFDNVDEKTPDWFIDTITAISTGSAITYRQLYKDVTDKIRVTPQAFIAITSRTPNFNRADLANRSIVNILGKDDKAPYDPFEFEQAIARDRQEIWKYLLAELQHILQNLAKELPKQEYKLRMTEFAEFIVHSCDEGDERKFINETIDLLVTTQSDFAAQDKPIVEALIAIAEDGERTFSAEDLLNKLNTEYSADFKDVRWMGRVLAQQADTITQFIYFRKKYLHGKIFYDINQKEQESLDID